MEAMEPETPQVQAPTPESEAVARRTQILIIAGAVLFLAILITAIILMANHPTATEVIRDIAIVFVAVETFLIGMALIVLILQIQALIKVLREETQPLLRSVNDTASTVRGTTEFVSENLVSPIIKVAGFTSAVRQVTQNLTGVVKAARPRSKPTQVQKGEEHNGQEE